MRFTVTFVKSCSSLRDLPAGATPEAALLGRSNVGKSSLLNALAGQHQLARTSRTPGRTRLLNLFSVNGGALTLVDCPGYGYARVARSERERWGEMIEPYLERRAQLRLALLLVDATLPAQAMDLELHAWLRHHRVPARIVATKWDRLGGNQRAAAAARLAAAYGEAPLGFSARTGEGRDALRHELLALAGAAAQPAIN